MWVLISLESKKDFDYMAAINFLQDKLDDWYNESDVVKVGVVDLTYTKIDKDF